MRSFIIPYLLMLVLVLQNLNGSDENFGELSTLPTLYKGRYIPIDVYSKNFLLENNIELSTNSLDQALLLHMQGHEKHIQSNNLIIKDRNIRNLLEIDTQRISFDSLIKKVVNNKELNLKLIEPIVVSQFWEVYEQQGKSRLTLTALHPHLKVQYSNNSITLTGVPEEEPWHYLKKGQIFYISPEQKQHYRKLSENLLLLFRSLTVIRTETANDPYLFEYETLKSKGFSQERINSTLNQKYPMQLRLASSLSSFLMLPDKSTPEIWYPLKAVKLKIYDEKTDSLLPISNFTAYSDSDFEAIRDAYIQLNSSLTDKSTAKETDKLSAALKNAYSNLSKTPYKQTSAGPLYFPSLLKLSIESYYSRIPWTYLLIISYSCSLLTLILPLKNFSYIPLLITFSIHTIALITRCFLMGRPPVSNMTETVLFVPWVSVITGLFLSYIYRSKIPLSCASAGSAILLLTLTLSNSPPPLENVQAVLNSQFWLTIHVLMVVGSYGAFLLSGILGHLYLILSLINRASTASMRLISKLTLQSIYLGLALLIPGTILGGVWAAQSWGRFWDWDPKESWAFISCCTYLIIVHAHYFGILRSYGLAIGSVIGFMVIAFTWYGVNYILGTGLHSYGFGNGGEHLFYLYLLVESIFLAINSSFRYAKRPPSEFGTP
ncbi:MAG: cytochrome c biogenesis protein CcsA [Chlamydiota bacterium]